MVRFGLDAKTIRGNDRLMIANYDDVYIVNGEVDVPGIIGKFANMVDTYKSRGLSGMRGAAEMSCFFQQDKVDELNSRKRLAQKVFLCCRGEYAPTTFYKWAKQDALASLWAWSGHTVPIIFASPNGYLIRKPEKIEEKHVEMIMQVQIRK